MSSSHSGSLIPQLSSSPDASRDAGSSAPVGSWENDLSGAADSVRHGERETFETEALVDATPLEDDTTDKAGPFVNDPHESIKGAPDAKPLESNVPDSKLHYHKLTESPVCSASRSLCACSAASLCFVWSVSWLFYGWSLSWLLVGSTVTWLFYGWSGFSDVSKYPQHFWVISIQIYVPSGPRTAPTPYVLPSGASWLQRATNKLEGSCSFVILRWQQPWVFPTWFKFPNFNTEFPSVIKILPRVPATVFERYREVFRKVVPDVDPSTLHEPETREIEPPVPPIPVESDTPPESEPYHGILLRWPFRSVSYGTPGILVTCFLFILAVFWFRHGQSFPKDVTSIAQPEQIEIRANKTSVVALVVDNTTEGAKTFVQRHLAHEKEPSGDGTFTVNLTSTELHHLPPSLPLVRPEFNDSSCTLRVFEMESYEVCKIDTPISGVPVEYTNKEFEHRVYDRNAPSSKLSPEPTVAESHPRRSFGSFIWEILRRPSELKDGVRLDAHVSDATTIPDNAPVKAGDHEIHITDIPVHLIEVDGAPLEADNFVRKDREEDPSRPLSPSTHLSDMPHAQSPGSFIPGPLNSEEHPIDASVTIDHFDHTPRNPEDDETRGDEPPCPAVPVENATGEPGLIKEQPEHHYETTTNDVPPPHAAVPKSRQRPSPPKSWFGYEIFRRTKPTDPEIRQVESPAPDDNTPPLVPEIDEIPKDIEEKVNTPTEPPALEEVPVHPGAVDESPVSPPGIPNVEHSPIPTGDAFTIVALPRHHHDEDMAVPEPSESTSNQITNVSAPEPQSSSTEGDPPREPTSHPLLSTEVPRDSAVQSPEVNKTSELVHVVAGTSDISNFTLPNDTEDGSFNDEPPLSPSAPTPASVVPDVSNITKSFAEQDDSTHDENIVKSVPSAMESLEPPVNAHDVAVHKDEMVDHLPATISVPDPVPKVDTLASEPVKVSHSDVESSSKVNLVETSQLPQTRTSVWRYVTIWQRIGRLHSDETLGDPSRYIPADPEDSTIVTMPEKHAKVAVPEAVAGTRVDLSSVSRRLIIVLLLLLSVSSVWLLYRWNIFHAFKTHSPKAQEVQKPGSPILADVTENPNESKTQPPHLITLWFDIRFRFAFDWIRPIVLYLFGYFKPGENNTGKSEIPPSAVDVEKATAPVEKHRETTIQTNNNPPPSTPTAVKPPNVPLPEPSKLVLDTTDPKESKSQPSSPDVDPRKDAPEPVAPQTHTPKPSVTTVITKDSPPEPANTDPVDDITPVTGQHQNAPWSFSWSVPRPTFGWVISWFFIALSVSWLLYYEWSALRDPSGAVHTKPHQSHEIKVPSTAGTEDAPKKGPFEKAHNERESKVTEARSFNLNKITSHPAPQFSGKPTFNLSIDISTEQLPTHDFTGPLTTVTDGESLVDPEESKTDPSEMSGSPVDTNATATLEKYDLYDIETHTPPDRFQETPQESNALVEVPNGRDEGPANADLPLCVPVPDQHPHPSPPPSECSTPGPFSGWSVLWYLLGWLSSLLFSRWSTIKDVFKSVTTKEQQADETAAPNAAATVKDATLKPEERSVDDTDRTSPTIDGDTPAIQPNQSKARSVEKLAPTASGVDAVFDPRGRKSCDIETPDPAVAAEDNNDIVRPALGMKGKVSDVPTDSLSPQIPISEAQPSSSDSSPLAQFAVLPRQSRSRSLSEWNEHRLSQGPIYWSRPVSSNPPLLYLVTDIDLRRPGALGQVENFLKDSPATSAGDDATANGHERDIYLALSNNATKTEYMSPPITPTGSSAFKVMVVDHSKKTILPYVEGGEEGTSAKDAAGYLSSDTEIEDAYWKFVESHPAIRNIAKRDSGVDL